MRENANSSRHPVVILIGELEACRKKLDSILQERSSMYSQIQRLEITHDSLESLFNFISVYSLSKKLVVGTIRKYDPHVIAALLKKIEDPPIDVDFIFLGNRFPRVMLTRGIVHRVYSISEEIKEQVLLEQYMISALLEGHIGKIEIGYKTWHKVLEVRKWIAAEQITQEDGIAMMKSIMELAQIKLPST